jgi:XTP/dITP diphosphohydrolase
MKTELIVATRNAGKLSEIRSILADLPVALRGPGSLPEVDETGATFAENATLKVRAAVAHSGCWALADDSGLEVDALHGQPGVYSARYGGEQARSDADRNMLLLEALDAVADELRTARFRAAIAVAAPDGRLWVCEGICDGVILREPRGSGGFGYDPLFFLPAYGQTMAELPPAIKNTISHRARALDSARRLLRRLLL